MDAKDLPLPHADKQEAVRKAFEVITRAREALPSDDGVSDKTAANYKAKADRMLRELDQCKETTVRQILERYAPVSRSFHAMRAAFVWHLKQEAKNLLSVQDGLQRREKQSTEWLNAVDHLERCLVLIDRVKANHAGDLLALTGEHKKAKHSKRKDLPKLPKNWKQLMLQRNARSPRYRLPTIVIAATGCRPEELAMGVELRLDSGFIVVKLRGAKVSKNSGQEWRQFKLLVDVMPPDVLQQIESKRTLTVSIASTDAFRAHLTRLSVELFPGKPAITGYSFRHSIAEDLRASGWAAEEIAAFLGQAVSETQSYYGRRRRKGKHAPEAINIERGSVETARPVRKLDRSGDLAPAYPDTAYTQCSAGCSG